MDRPSNGEKKKNGTTPSEEPFVQCPEFFLTELTPAQYLARLQLYQQAYERARAKANEVKPFVPPFEFEFRDGI